MRLGLHPACCVRIVRFSPPYVTGPDLQLALLPTVLLPLLGRPGSFLRTPRFGPVERALCQLVDKTHNEEIGTYDEAT